jgi:hypothetical protein
MPVAKVLACVCSGGLPFDRELVRLLAAATLPGHLIRRAAQGHAFADGIANSIQAFKVQPYLAFIKTVRSADGDSERVDSGLFDEPTAHLQGACRSL